MPLALATGAGAESRISMGVTVVGGMFFATFLTLFVAPSIYSYVITSYSIHYTKLYELGQLRLGRDALLAEGIR